MWSTAESGRIWEQGRIQLNTFTPVGTAMIIDIIPKTALTSGPAPMVKK